MKPETIPELTIDLLTDVGADNLILLQQDAGGNLDRVAIHPFHLRYLAEKFGLIESSDPMVQKTIATLTRRLLVLRDRANHLVASLADDSDHKHADLSYAHTYAEATADIANEFCTELGTVSPCKHGASTVQTLCKQGENTMQAPCGASSPRDTPESAGADL